MSAGCVVASVSKITINRPPSTLSSDLLTIRSAVPATAVVTGSQLLRLTCESIDLRSRPVKGTPSHHIGPVVALAADPAATKLLEKAKLVRAFGFRVDGRGIGGVVAWGREAGVSVEVSGDAVVVGHGGVLAWVPLWMTDAHVSSFLIVVLCRGRYVMKRDSEVLRE